MKTGGHIAREWADVTRFLVVRLDNMGDVVLTGPALRALKRAFPGSSVTLLASPAGSRAATLLPWVDRVVTRRAVWQEVGARDFAPGDEWAFLRSLRDQAFEAAVILTSFNQTPFAPALACLLAGIPLRLGESGESDPGLLTHQVPPAPLALHQAERNTRLLASVGIVPAGEDPAVQIPAGAARAIGELLGEGMPPYLVVAPWASAPARTYSPEWMIEAAWMTSQAAGLSLVLTGGAKDRAAATELCTRLGKRASNLAGRTTVSELAALIAGARLVFTNNSLPLHLADACAVPVVVTYSGTDLESQWSPRRAPARLLRRPTWCHPCYEIRCPFKLECLDLPPAEVVRHALELLAESSSP